MANLVQILDDVPDQLFSNCLTEINSIKWENVNDRRSLNPVFSTSTSIHLRVHKPPPGIIPKTVNEWSKIVECMDNPYTIKLFPNIMTLTDWIFKKVNGVILGRVMIVKLEPQGVVDLHIDPEDYFAMHSRYHVPLVTNPGVVFSGGPDTPKEHMPVKKLSRLNNRLPHMLENLSDQFRIHVIADIQTPDLNTIF